MESFSLLAALGSKPGSLSPAPGPVDDTGAVTRRQKILVIEDDPIVALGIEELLAEAGYDVLASFARGEEALAAADREHPDLILADVKLAGIMDGVEAVAAILARHPIPVIFITAHTDPLTRGRMEARRPAQILAKPVPDRLLLRAVAAALGR